MNNYEITIVLPAGGKDKEAMSRVEKEIKDAGGTIDKTEEWGKRELAYVIKKQGGPAGGHREGVYFSLEVQLPPDKVGGVNRFLETNEGVLRHLVVRINSKSKILNPKQETASAKAGQSTKSKTKSKSKVEKVVKKGKQNGNSLTK